MWNKHEFRKILCTLAAMPKKPSQTTLHLMVPAGACVFFFIILLAVLVFWGCSCILMFRRLFVWMRCLWKDNLLNIFLGEIADAGMSFPHQKKNILRGWTEPRTKRSVKIENRIFPHDSRWTIQTKMLQNCVPPSDIVELSRKTQRLYKQKNWIRHVLSVTMHRSAMELHQVVVRMRGDGRNPAKQTDWNTTS